MDRGLHAARKMRQKQVASPAKPESQCATRPTDLLKDPGMTAWPAGCIRCHP